MRWITRAKKFKWIKLHVEEVTKRGLEMEAGDRKFFKLYDFEDYILRNKFF